MPNSVAVAVPGQCSPPHAPPPEVVSRHSDRKCPDFEEGGRRKSAPYVEQPRAQVCRGA